MMRLFFQLDECGTITDDTEGQDVADLAAARATAVRSARAIMCNEITDGKLCLACSIRVTDDRGDTVLMVPFREAVKVSGL